MKKVNKTLLLASTLFISTALAGGSKVYADDFNTLDKQKMADALDASQEKNEEPTNIQENSGEAVEATTEKESAGKLGAGEDAKATEESKEENTDIDLANEEEKAKENNKEIPVRDIEKDRNPQAREDLDPAKEFEILAPRYTRRPVVKYEKYNLDSLLVEHRKNVEREKKAQLARKNQPAWHTSGAKTYYKNNNNGYVARGFADIGGSKYYFDNAGVLQRDKKIFTGDSYYESDSRGVVTKKTNSWVSFNKQSYYTDAQGKITKGLKKINGSYYRFDNRGVLETNKKEIVDDKLVYTDKSGRITNPRNFWFAKDGKTYRTGNDGSLLKGVQQINNYTYAFDDRGRLRQNETIKHAGKFLKLDNRGVGSYPKNAWVTYGGNTYHTNASGYIQEGVWNINGLDYYFTSNGLARNTEVTQRGVIYKVDNRGVAIPKENNLKGEKNLDKAMEWMFTAKKAGLEYSMHWKERVSDTAADCSSAVFRALMYGGFINKGTWPGNTETLFQLGSERKIMYQIDESEIRYGDIFVAGYPGGSGGADGHTGFILNRKNDTIIHMNYGANGVSITPRKGRMGDGRGLPVRYYRLVGAQTDWLFENQK